MTAPTVWLRWPSPMVDPTVAIDAITGFDAASSTMTLASGAEVAVTLTVPVPGVLRIRTGDLHGGAPSPMLVDLPDERPAEVGDGGRITGPGVDATWDASGLRVGAFATAPAQWVLHHGAVSSGRLGSGESAGWLVTAALGRHDRVFGGGESFQSVDLRGRVKRLVNVETHGQANLDAAYLTVPFVWSDAGWGLFAHTGAPARLDAAATADGVLALATEDEHLDLFVITGGDGTAVLQRYLALTGRPGRFPDWAYGVWTSRCSYLSEDEVQEVVDGYERADCPVDVVHVDAWVEGNVVADLACNWRPDRERFPAGWGRRLAERGVRLSLWHNPFVVADSDLGRELAADGLLIRRADDPAELARTADMATRAVLDLTDPRALDWWRERIGTTAASEHVASFKPDFGEEVPVDGVLADGRPARAARNEYSVRYQRATHDALAEATGDDAVALFCRSGTAGAQRYPCHWVGDTPSTWDGLTAALRACLSLSLSGFAFVASDVGGFWTGGSHEWVAEAMATMDSSGVRADVDPELFARWAQWGAFSPVLRFHGTGRREPWAYPDPWGSAAVAACRLRARLRPYLVAAGVEAAETGLPLMRPTALTDPDDADARAADLQYLLGPDVLVAPVLDPGGRRRLWVPPGAWTPLLAPVAVEGPGWVTVECGPDQFPVWSRQGSAVLG